MGRISMVNKSFKMFASLRTRRKSVSCANSVWDVVLCKSSCIFQHSKVLNRKIVRRYQSDTRQSVLVEMTFADDEGFCLKKYVDICSDILFNVMHLIRMSCSLCYSKH